MRIRIFLLNLFICIPLCAEPRKEFDELELVDGKVYKNVVIRKKHPDGISIIHAGGLANIPYEKIRGLDQNLMGGFNEKEAKVYRENIEKKEAERRKAADKIIASRQDTTKAKEPEKAKRTTYRYSPRSTNKGKAPNLLNTSWSITFKQKSTRKVISGWEASVQFARGGKCHTLKRKPHNIGRYPTRWRQQGHVVEILFNTGEKDRLELSGDSLRGSYHDFNKITSRKWDCISE